MDVKPTFVADSDRMAVVVRTVSTNHLLWTTGLDGSISANDVVVADAFPSFGTMPLVYLLGAGCLIRFHGTAVDDDEGDCSCTPVGAQALCGTHFFGGFMR